MVTRLCTEYAFRGCFHDVREDRLVQTFTYEGFPDSVALETMTFEDLGGGRTRLHLHSMFDSYEGRDGMLSSGMDVGVNDGYAKLDALLSAGAVTLSGPRAWLDRWIRESASSPWLWPTWSAAARSTSTGSAGDPRSSSRGRC